MLRTLFSRGPARIWLLAALLIAVTPASASAFSKAIWGDVYRNGVNQFPIYNQLGVKIYEHSLQWNVVAPTRPGQPTNPNDPAYHWPADIDQAVTQAQVFHMQILLQILNTPSWANGGKGATWAPKKASDFAAFAIAAARRYPTVHLWMIWGEPSRYGEFQPLYSASASEKKLTPKQQIAPHNYARLLDAAYGALKSVSRSNLVLGGSTYATGAIDTQQWIQNLRLPNGRPPRMDMYAHNPFTFTDPTTAFGRPSPLASVQFNDLGRLAKWVDRYLHRGIPLFLSEWTVPTCPDQEFNFWVDPPVAARWVRDALRVSRRWHRIYALGWVHVYDVPGVSCGGLLTSGGKRKPDFSAFAAG